MPRGGSGWALVPVGFPWLPAAFRRSLVQEGRARRSARHLWRGPRCVLLSIASRFHRRPIKSYVFLKPDVESFLFSQRSRRQPRGWGRASSLPSCRLRPASAFPRILCHPKASGGFVPLRRALSPWGELQGKGSSSSHPSPASFLGRPRAPGAGSRQLSNFTGWSSLRGWSFVSRSCFSSRLRIPCHHCWQPRSCRVRTAPRCQEHHGTGRRGTGYNQKPDAGKTGFKRKKKNIKYQKEKH